MTALEALRLRAARVWRALWPAVVVAGGAITCDGPTHPGRVAVLSVVPVYSLSNISRFAGLTIDEARLTVIVAGSDPAETLTTKTISFPADSPSVQASIPVQVSGATEDVTVLVELLAGGTLMFTGSVDVTISAGATSSPPPSNVNVGFVGPGNNVTGITLTPLSPATQFGGTIPFSVTAHDGQNNPVGQFYVSWSTHPASPGTTSSHTINGNGLFKAGNQRGSAWVVAELPNGVAESTQVAVSAQAASVQVVSGSGQSGSPGTQLAQPLVARVMGADNLPVQGATVTFAAATGGGSVAPSSGISDASGQASTIATLGSGTGSQTFTAAVAGLAPATFSATSVGTAQITLALVGGGNLVPVSGSSGLIVTIPSAAPAGGVTVTVTSDNTANVTVNGGPAVIAAGQTRDTLQLIGVAIGTANINASTTTPGIAAATPLPVGVTPSFITINPPAITVGVSSNTTAQLQLSTPAPAGGVTVSLSSSDVNRVTVPASVNIAASQSTANFQVNGGSSGQAAILATATGYAQGAALVTVGGSSIPTVINRIAGDNQTAYINDTTATRPKVQVLDAGGAPVLGATVNFLPTAGGGSIAQISTTTDATGFATAPAAWKMGSAPGNNQLTAQTPAFPSVLTIFNATAQNPPPLIQLNVFGSNVVGVGRTGQLDVTLLQPAPAGGLTVTVVSDSTQYLTVAAPGTISFAQGETQHSIVVNGVTQSPASPNQGARVRATATGYTPDTLFIPVSVNLISLPTTLNVPLNQTVSLGITLSTPAPAGGVQVAVSSNSGNVAVTTPTVTIAQGGTVGSASVRGDALGSATITATNPNYAPFQSTVTATASLNVIQPSVSLNASFGSPIVVQLESGGLPVSAPAGGVAVTMTPRNTACAAAANTTIPAGVVSVGVNVTYGGSATLPCSTYIVASGPAGFVIDSALANVAVQPALTSATVNIGSGLQRNTTVSLGATNHGGTTVHLVSNAPGVLLLSPDQVTPGTTSIDIPVGISGSSAGFYFQAVEGRIADTVTMTASAPGFVNGTLTVRVWQPVIDVQGLATTGTPFDANRPVYARIGTPSAPLTGTISSLDEIRAGGTPITVTFGLNDSTVARLIGQAPGRADTATAVIPVLGTNSPTTFAAGGVNFDVVGAGSVTTTATSTVARPSGTGNFITTVISAPTISVPTLNLGAGLQRNTSATLGATQHGGVTVHIASADPNEAVLSLDNVTPGTASIDVIVPNGQNNVPFYVQGVEGRIADTSVITVTAPGFLTGTGAVRVWQPVIDIQGVTTTSTTLDANRAIYARVGTPSAPLTGTISALDEIRAGGTPLTVTFALNDSTVARLIGQAAGRADTTTAVIPVQGTNSPTTFAAGGVNFDVVGAGSVTTTATSTVARPSGTGNFVTTVVSAPTISAPTLNLGAGLQRNTSASLGATQHGGVTVHIVSADPAEAVLSLDNVTPGTASIDVIVPNGQNNVPFYVQGVEGRIADTSVITVTAPGFQTGTGAVRVWQPVYDLQGVPATAGSLDADRNIYTRIGTPSAPLTGTISALDEIRAGGTPLTATFNSSTATVAQLTTSSTTPGSQQTAQIVVGQTNTPTTVATGGVGLDVLTAGATTVSVTIAGLRPSGTTNSLTMNVSAPTISVGAPTVGSGLQENSSASLSTGNHNGVDVTVSSSNPSIALVSPDAVTPGATSIIVHLNNLQTTVSYYVQGVEGISTAQQVTIRVQAPGFTDGTATASIVKPAIDVQQLAATGSAASTADDPFQVRLGVPNAQLTGLNVLQEVRAGAPGPLSVTLTSTAPAFGLLKLFGASSGSPSIAVSIPVGASVSPLNVTGGALFEFVAQGITFVVPSATNYTAMQQSVVGTDGFRVTVNP